MEARFTRGAGDATVIARELALNAAHTIVCVGGDGTLNEVVNGLIGADGPLNLATRLALDPVRHRQRLRPVAGRAQPRSALRALDYGYVAGSM